MAGDEEVAAIPLVEERLAISKKQVETSRLRVRIEVDEREETVPVELMQEEVEVERVPRNVPVSELPAVRLEGGTTVIPVVEEVVVVEKRLVLVEEIHVRRRSGSRQERIPVVLRSERASIEREDTGAAAAAQPEDAQ
jgi:uncharacterized protein (TIGR02271 family)